MRSKNSYLLSAKKHWKLLKYSTFFIARRILIILISLFCLPSSGYTEKVKNPDFRAVEAAYLRNFAHYVNWPENTFSNDLAPWHICVLGDDPFGELLENTLQGRSVKDRPFSIFRTHKISELDHCQIVYVAYMISMSRRAAIAELKKLPILTVSDAPEFLQEGGIIRFDISDYVKININLDQARSSSLNIQTKMLEVSSEVVDHGTIRHLR
jgi:hypothetical protein